MCGRYVSVSTPEQYASHFEVAEVRTGSLGARYNVAPTLEVYAVVAADGQRRLGSLRWGFVPYWSPGPRQGPSPINARVETIARNRMFADSFGRRRCLLPADGFYEWQERPEGRRKQPWFIHLPEGEPMAFAGIWSRWRPRDGTEAGTAAVHSTAIVTTAAAGRMAELHDRMPVVLPRRLWDAWLDPEAVDPGRLSRMLAALDPPALEARRVSDRVNDVRNDGPDLIEPGSIDAD